MPLTILAAVADRTLHAHHYHDERDYWERRQQRSLANAGPRCRNRLRDLRVRFTLELMITVLRLVPRLPAAEG